MILSCVVSTFLNSILAKSIRVERCRPSGPESNCHNTALSLRNLGRRMVGTMVGRMVGRMVGSLVGKTVEEAKFPNRKRCLNLHSQIFELLEMRNEMFQGEVLSSRD
jgi:hypothetical protein